MSQELSETEAFVLLSNRRRRLVLQTLQESTNPLAMTVLAERIGAREREDPSPEDVQSIYIALYHSHLPKLEEASVVSCDWTEATVQPGLNFDRLIHTLAQVTERDLPWAGE